MEKVPQIPKFYSRKTIGFIRKLLGLLVYFIFLQTATASSLPTFILNLSKTDETCLGNGSLIFSVSGADPAASIQFKIYQLPDLVNPIAIQISGPLGGRTSGTYRVLATQTLNGESNSQFQEITINNAIVPLTYTVSSTNARCGNDGSLTVTTTSGISVQYEIISGPVIRPLQASNVFNMIPAGVYGVRVFNDCGDGVVVTHTLLSDAPGVDISQVSFPDAALPSCSSIIVANNLTPPSGAVLSYPINVVYNVFSPSGAIVATIPVSYPTGNADGQEVKNEIPFFYDQPYHYTVTVTDGCGNTYTLDNAVNKKLEVLLAPNNADCGDYFLIVRPTTYFPPFMITFTTVAGDFIAVDYNEDHPGPFSSEITPYGGSQMPVPYGSYAVTITDSCGHTASDDVTLTDEPNDPAAAVLPYPGCQSDMSLVKININGIDLANAFIIIAPAAYSNPLPADVSASITQEDGLVLQFLPEGHYLVHLIDECGQEYDFEFDVPGLATNPVLNVRPDCEIGKGTIRIRVNSASLLSVIMTSAPAGFSGNLPYDVSFNITGNGVFSMNDLPEGEYTFEVADSCGLTNTVTQNITGYKITANDISLTPHCGSFDLNLIHLSNANVGLGFWLQRYDQVANNWTHPDTGVVYVAGTLPDATNSREINANANNLNLIYLGTFRILKRFETFDNGSVGQLKNCIEVLKEFVFDGSFDITFQKVTCGGALADLKVIANGVPPFTYRIVKKNGADFVVDNGANNIFVGLETAIYTFEVEDLCNNIASGNADVSQLPSAAQANQPNDLTLCDDGSGTGNFDLAAQNAMVLGSQSAADFLISYHESLSDATSGINPLPDNYISASKIIFVRLKYIANPACFDVTQFALILRPKPVLMMQTVYGICPNGTTTITADSGFDSYLWSTGETTASIAVSVAGIYTLEVQQNGCSSIYNIDVLQSMPATIQSINTSDWTDNSNSIEIILANTGTGSYGYSIDGINYQSSNVFYGLSSGAYTVFVKDTLGCGEVTEEVYLLNYIKYFTPNGDGFHDYWRVIFAETEPHLITYIFDRYGKLLTGFGVDSLGWDGTLNGEKLPSTDYWFLVVRENGKQLRGHFSMKR